MSSENNAAIDPSGNIKAVWKSTTSAAVQTSFATFSSFTWSTPVTVPSGSSQNLPTIVVDNYGDYNLVYEANPSGTQVIQGNTSTLNGSSSSATNLSSAASSAPMLAGGPNGYAVATWTNTASPSIQASIYTATPLITSVSPNFGSIAGGNSVVITGGNFTGTTGTTGVKFGSTNATSYTVNSDTQITATAPAGSPGTVDITVTTPGGTSSIVTADQYSYETTPTVTNVSPNFGSTAGGNSVVITGTSFLSATNVAFGLTNATFTINSDTQITATAPAESAGTVDITVTNPYGTSAMSSADQYTYETTPTVTNVTPNGGPYCWWNICHYYRNRFFRNNCC